jgi:hypothetical protein
MDPQQNPVNQPTPAPIAPLSPIEQVPVATQTPTPSSSTPASQVPAARSSKRVLISVLAGIAIIVLALLAGLLLTYFTPAAKSKRLSNSFMHSITTGDVAMATELTGDNTAKVFLTASSKSVNGSYKLSASQFSNGKGYYLYILNGADNKYARTIIQIDNGKRVVHSFVFSNTTLALVPSSNTTVGATTNNSSTTQSASTPPSSSGCLAANDFSVFSNLGHSLPTANSNNTFSDFYQLEFNPDVATYAAGDIPDPTTVYNDFKNFYAQSANKKYTIELESSVNSATPDEPLANARNQKVQSDLETISGIPASKITIQPITNDTSGSSAGNAFYRQVQITLRSANSCSSLN